MPWPLTSLIASPLLLLSLYGLPAVKQTDRAVLAFTRWLAPPGPRLSTGDHLVPIPIALHTSVIVLSGRMLDIPDFQALVSTAALVAVITRPPALIFKYPRVGMDRYYCPSLRALPEGSCRTRTLNQPSSTQGFWAWDCDRQMPTRDTTLF